MSRVVALLFAGQGAAEERMGVALAAAAPRARALLDAASDATGMDVPALLARGGAALDRTEVLQPVLVAVELGAADALRERGVEAALVAGHSLGELAAWSASGAIPAEEAIQLAARRGLAMAEAARLRPGGMIALTGAGPAEVDSAIDAGRPHGLIALAAQNSPGEWVLAGDDRALDAAVRSVTSRRLRVAGPWHSEAMRPATSPFAEALARVTPRPATPAFVSGVTGDVAAAERVPALLVEQLVAPVRWTSVLGTLVRHGVTDVVIPGPARVLRGLLRENLRAAVRVHAVGRPEDVPTVAEVIAA